VLFAVTSGVKRLSARLARQEVDALARPLLASPHQTAVPWEEAAPATRRSSTGAARLRSSCTDFGAGGNSPLVNRALDGEEPTDFVLT
jgi:hypothetical protein